MFVERNHPKNVSLLRRYKYRTPFDPTNITLLRSYKYRTPFDPTNITLLRSETHYLVSAECL
jgi:hypothetical protein